MSLKEKGYNFCQNERLGKIQRFLLHFHQGRKYQYPICCVLRFAIEDSLRDGKTFPIEDAPGERRGSVVIGNPEDDRSFVPCNVFHRSQEKHTL